ncbi:hypothetical protein PROFUN_09950 [Planoprotostelium fungivorum]|uniref:Calponin-homology (CH) domain-containing protein n=1 Tax=Planoprotostelium fungivorum TaxID=1890364 RepID=A0A2P6NGD0_9EUKA|nr:hypothetical protein PROFUN_09950 [Planoprotostelium fungivorum]
MEAHRCRFIEFKGAIISSISIKEKQDKNDDSNPTTAAVGLSNGDIQLWINYQVTQWSHTQTIHGSSPGLTSVVWVKDRLFSAGFNGSITEWDLHTLQPSYFPYEEADTLVTGNTGLPPVWCLSVCNAQKAEDSMDIDEQVDAYIAAGCEDGGVRVFAVSKDKPIHLIKTARRSAGRILSVAWRPDGTELACGSASGIVNVWNTRTWKNEEYFQVEVLNVGGSKLKPVWAIAYLPDGTIITGDYRGTITLWDRQTITVLQSFTLHVQDVLALSVSQDGTKIYATGVDSKMIILGKQQEGFVQIGNFRPAQNDIKAIGLSREWLLFGGADGHLYTSSAEPNQKFTRQDIFANARNCFQFVREHNLLVARFYHAREIEVWKLGKRGQKVDLKKIDQGEPVELMENARQIVRIVPQSGSIIYTRMSPDGRYIAYSDAQQFRLLHFREGIETPKRIKKIPEIAASRFVFTLDGKTLLLATLNGDIQVWDVEDANDIRVKKSFTFNEGEEKSIAAEIALHANEQTLAVVTHRRNSLLLVNLKTFKIERVSMRNHITSMRWIDNTLVMVRLNNQLLMYSLGEKRFTPWISNDYQERVLSEHPFFSTPKSPIIGIAEGPSPNKFILYSSSHFIVVNMKQQETIKMYEDFRPMIFLQFAGEQVIVVERPLNELIASQTSVVYRRKVFSKKEGAGKLLPVPNISEPQFATGIGYRLHNQQENMSEDAAWVRIQSNTFRNWANSRLQPRSLEIKDLHRDLGTGVLLINLAEELTKDKMPKYAPTPKMRSQYLDNMNICLNFLKGKGLKLVNIDIVDNNHKIILGLLWSLIQKYQIAAPPATAAGTTAPPSDAGDNARSARRELLLWLQKTVPSANINNFGSDWLSGEAIIKLIGALVPGSTPSGYEQWSPLQRSQWASSYAHREMSIPPVLSPEDFVDSNVDEQSVMTYVAQYKQFVPKTPVEPTPPPREPTPPPPEPVLPPAPTHEQSPTAWWQPTPVNIESFYHLPFSMRSWRNTYLCADEKGKLRLADEADHWEQWRLVRGSQPGLYYLKSWKGTYLCGDANGTPRQAPKPDIWEEWSIYQIKPGKYGLLSYHSTHLSVDDKGKPKIVPHQTMREEWELFFSSTQAFKVSPFVPPAR